MTVRNRFLLKMILLFIFVSPAWAEPAELLVRGKVLEEGTRKPLEGMTVYALERENESVVSGRDGGFTLTIGPAGEYSLTAVGLGYKKSKPLKITIDPAKETEEIVLYLEPVYSMQEVVVQADRNQDKTAKTVISGKELASVPGSAGDPLRGMQALPGITTVSDFGSNPAIRGSGPQNNAYYVDFLPVGYLFHSGGLVSVVNADLVQDFNIFASSFGPEFADVTGGVIDVKLRDPRKDRIGGKIDISTFGANWLLEGPASGNQSFYLGARRSYYDLIMPKHGDFGSGVQYRQFPQYYDYQGKYVWDISADHTLTLQTSGADDQMKLTFTSDSDAVKHDPILAGDLNFDLSYNTLGAVLASKLSPEVNNKLGLSYLDTSLKEHLTQLGHVIVNEDLLFVRDHVNITTGKNNDVLFGVEYGLTKVRLDLDVPTVVPSDFNSTTPNYTDSPRFVGTDKFDVHSWEIALKDRWKIFEPLTLVAGGRASYDDYLGRQVVEPRLGAEYQVRTNTLVTAGWGKYHQFPAGYQVIKGFGNPNLNYEKAEHYDLGVEQHMDDGWSVKVEEYYKKLYSLVVPYQPTNYTNGGSGKAYGTELLIKKDRTTNWWGWISVGYTKTKRHNDVTGEDFPAPYDQPYIINVVYEWKITPKWTFGAKWRYQTGAPFTPVIGATPVTDTNGNIVRYLPAYGALGSERLPDYHRLDLRIAAEVWSGMRKVSLYVEIINAYDRKNVSGYDYNENYTSRKPITELPILPVFGVQMEF